MNALVTGGAGFIGGHLIDSLLKLGHNVVCVDNFELGNREIIDRLKDNCNFEFYEADASDIDAMDGIMGRHNIEQVFHLAANSDIQKSAKDPAIDLKNTFSTTATVLEGMRRNNIKKLFFSSTSAVYGDRHGVSLNETIGELAPISYYGGAKLASEAFISSYAYMNDFDVTIFRFPNVIGPRLTHGVIFDFVKKLQANPKELEILGDGTQNKPYIYVLDLVNMIIDVSMSGERGVEIYNIGVETSTSVKRIADLVCAAMKLENVNYKFSGGNIGWKGDVPSFQYDLSKIHERGYRAELTSDEAVEATLHNLHF